MKRIGFIGDVHAEDQRLEIALATLQTQNIECIACVGDVVDGPGDIERTVALLRDYDVETVRGNHERWFLSGEMRDLPDAHSKYRISESTREWLAALPLMIELPTMAGKVLVCHGLGADDMATITPSDDVSLIRYNVGFRKLRSTSSARFVLSGHSHRRMVRRVEDRVFINAGTLYREHDPCFGLIDFEAALVRFWEFDTDLSIDEIVPISLSAEEQAPETRR